MVCMCIYIYKHTHICVYAHQVDPAKTPGCRVLAIVLLSPRCWAALNGHVVLTAAGKFCRSSRV